MRYVHVLVAAAALLASCGDGGRGDGDGGTAGSDAPAATADARPSTTGGSCEPLPAPTGTVIEVGPGDDLAAALADAPAGATVSLADGTYDVPATGLWIGADGVTLRSASGQEQAVVLDAAYGNSSGGVINIAGRADVTIAHLTIRRARYHAVHVTGGMNGPSVRARIYSIVASDPGEQAIKINSNYGFDSDDGEVACSRIELTDAGRAQVQSYQSAGSNCYTGGIDAHRARDWIIRDNVIEGFWCDNGDLSEHGVHFWNGSRDTLVERNLFIDDARGIGFGLGEPTGARTYDDDPCPGAANIGHFGGIIRNNMIVATRTELFASPTGMDLGIGLESACRVTVAHNTVASTAAPFSSIEWRFAGTSVDLVNNLVSHNLRERGGSSTQGGNIADAPAAMFVDLAGHDLHLAPDAAAIDAGAVSQVADDFDGDARDSAPDVGADEIQP